MPHNGLYYLNIGFILTKPRTERMPCDVAAEIRYYYRLSAFFLCIHYFLCVMIRYYALYYLIHASRIEQPAKTITKDEVLHSSKLYNTMIAVLFLVLFFKLQSFLD